MAEFESDELAQLKRWWEKNGASVVIGAVLGLVIVGGWQGWRWYANNQAVAAANSYQKLEQRFAAGKVDDAVVKQVDRLQADYAGTPYAADAALRLAAWYVRDKQYDKAAKQLEWAMNNASQDGIADIARVRAARLAWARGDPDAALKLLDHAHPDSFDSLYAELAGDIHAAQGNREAAYKSYQLALERLPADAPRQPLQDKLADSAPDDGAAADGNPKTAAS